MKIFRLLSFVASVLMATATFAQNAITALDASVRQGNTGDLVIKYQFDEAEKYAAFQFIITLPEGITLSTEEDDIVKDNSISKHGVVITLQEDKSYTVTGNANPTSLIPGTEGVLMTLKLIADPSISVGTTLDAAHIKNVKFSNEGGTKYDVDESTFNISIVDNLITLNELSTVFPEPSDGVGVKVIRTIKPNEWSTICLPFDMSEAQVKAAFGSDVQLGDFTGYTATTENNAITSIEVHFSSVSAIEKNRPYIIKVTDLVSSFDVDNVTIDPVDEPKNAVKDGRREWSIMNGTYVAETEVPEDCLFLNGNKFWYSNGSTKMKAFRAYFDFSDVLTDKNLNSNISFAYDEADGINQMEMGQQAEGVYNLQGQKVHTDVSKSVKKGVYIINGKKVVR